jgi:hypothetical protein
VVASSADTPRLADRWPALLIALAIMAFPLLKPHGPAHITPDDVLIAASILGVLMWAGTYRVPMHLPYAVPIAVLAITGLLAAMLSVQPDASSLAVVQDLFVFAWAAAIANAVLISDTLSIILASWAWSAIAWAWIVVVTLMLHQPWLPGLQHSGHRAQLLFDNPNMAGNYFLLSFFVLLLSPQPRNRVARALAYLIVVTAIILTGSNGALLSLAVGGAVAGLFALWRRTSMEMIILIGSITVALVVGLVFFAAESGMLSSIDNSSNPILKRSLARSPKSAEGRRSLFTEEFDLYRNGSFVGIGPATTKANLELSSGQIVKEAHDDYLATLVERGPIGAVGLLLLMAAVGVRAFSVARRPPPELFARTLNNPSAIIGVVVAMAVFATTHEILHYRHVWAFLGILGGVHLFGRPMPSTRARVGSVSPVGGGS